MNKINQVYHQQPLPLPNKTKTEPSQNQSFKSVLQQVADEGVKVSKHAQKRLDERGIHISDQQWSQIESKMNEAKQKGITESAIVMRDSVLVASTKNDTIVTAMDRSEASNQLLTNINGTIILNED
ncbi:TIGR02530 family flagellar biosynthesis protein [Alkalibacillus almallahensis]|uniref:TIGR02530 family flagellar biosynthesis protein n=1 Tax=Alkalibacillus almallahensis TaxID=1379154 RepID=UPI0014238F8D|nr:TIGR02530 family flagellar biosynthesis protein [Alkalibacillus almallahensis]NIK10792.1 flagellar operon protein [Alkalibacillus almallahensis]